MNDNDTGPYWWQGNIASDNAVGQQAITWANIGPDLCHHLASLGHNE